MYDKKHQLRKTHTGVIKLYAPRDKWQRKLMEYGALSIRYGEDGKEIWDSKHRGNMVHMTDVEIVSTVNAEIRGDLRAEIPQERVQNPAEVQKKRYLLCSL